MPPQTKPQTYTTQAGVQGNIPPQALEAEEFVLCALLVDSSLVDEAMEELGPNCFYDQRNQKIFEAMSALVAEHVQIDIISLTQKLKARGDLETVGGTVRIAELSQKIAAAANFEYYVRVLKQKTIQRDLIQASLKILESSYDDSVAVDDLIDMAQSRVYDAIQNSVKKDVQEIGAVIKAAMDDIEKMQGSSGLSGVPSGYPSIDAITMGWQPSDLIILAARPSVGKTAFALNIARNAAVDHNMPVAVFSLEMPAIQLAKRLMISETGLSADKIKGGTKLEPHEWTQLEYKLKALSKSPLYVDDTPSLPIMEFRTKVKRLVNSKGVRLVIVDYLQLMQGPAELRGLREQEVAAISRTLKATAKELNVPIIALSQLSRQAVQRSTSNGKPMLSDLRESGSIEQDADMVIFVHRPDYLGLAETPNGKETTEIIIAKHRNGETADIPMLFKSEMVRFVEPNDTLLNGAGTSYESRMNEDVPYVSSPAEDDFPEGPIDSYGPDPLGGGNNSFV